MDDIAPVVDALRREIEQFMSRVTSIAANHPEIRRISYDHAGNKSTAASRFVRQMLKERRERDNVFGADLFGEPAWDMLLDLFVAAEERKMVSVSSLCIAASVPSTTALRWIGNLTARGIIHRTADPTDRRRIFLELAPHTRCQLQSLVAGWMADQS
jgi:DNA-binding MarR family transcriptional regulator